MSTTTTEEKPLLVQICTRVNLEEAEMLQTIANNERRSLSNLLAVIVTDYCQRKLNPSHAQD